MPRRRVIKQIELFPRSRVCLHGSAAGPEMCQLVLVRAFYFHGSRKDACSVTPLCSQTERAREVSVPARLPPEHFGRRSFPNPFMLRTPSMNPANSYSLFYFPGNVELLEADLEGRPAVKTNGEMETQTGAT